MAKKKRTGRKLTALLALSVLLLSLLTVSAGAQQTADGRLQIGTAEELDALFAMDFAAVCEADIVLTDDIDMSGHGAVAPLGMTADGTVTAFNGCFDGQGHVIKNLVITGITDTDDAVDCTGFFGCVGEAGRIVRLGLDNVTVSGVRNVGALAGCLTGSVSRCYVTGTVSGSLKVGGMAGILHAATVDNCWLRVDVQASGNTAGGLFGDANYNSRGPRADGSPLTARSERAMSVTNTLILGSVSGKGRLGGMLGDVGNSLTSPLGSFDGNVVWTGQITYTNDGAVGPVCGWWSDANYLSADENRSLYCSGMLVNGTAQTYTETAANIFEPVSADTLGLQASYENKSTGLGWDFTNIWVWSHELGHPVLREVTAPGAGEPMEQKTPASLITTLVGSAKTGRAFTWYTDTSVTETVVQAVAAADYIAGDDAVFTGAAAIEATGTCDTLQTGAHGETRNIHKAELTGLTAGTTYYYRAGGNGCWSDVYAFTTEGEDAESFTFFSMTDTQGSGYTNYSNYENFVTVLEDAVTRYPDGAFILHGGDVIQNNYLEHYDKIYALTQEYVASLPVMLTPGNHELGKNTLGYLSGLENLNSHYQFPDNGPEGCSETVYSFDYGNAHFAVLDSNKTVSYAEQIAWLKEDMAATDKTWKIVSIHVGPYNNYGKGTQSLIDAMDELEIDLVLFGHNHAFLRSNPIKNGVTDASAAGYDFLDSEGTVYYSSGCAGGTAGKGGGKDDQASSAEKMAGTYFPVRNYDAARSPLYGAVTVSFDTLTVSTYAVSDHKLVDEFVITSPSVKAPAAKQLTYNGAAQELVRAGAVTGGTMLYSLDGVTYSADLPTAVNAGTYTVWYQTHLSDEPGRVEVTIDRLDIGAAEVTLGPALTFTGKLQTQTVERVVVDGLTASYTVSGNTAVEAGEYTLTVTGTENFCGSVQCVWTIAERGDAGDEDADRPGHEPGPGPDEKPERGEGCELPHGREKPERDPRGRNHKENGRPGKDGGRAPGRHRAR